MFRNLAFAVLLATCSVSAAAQVTYTFFDPERDETFEVYALVDGDELTGLATFEISLSGLESTPLEPETFVYTPVLGGLENLSSSFMLRGFIGPPVGGAAGADGYAISETQLPVFNPSSLPLLGFGAVDTFVDAAITLPNNLDIDGTLVDVGFGVVGALLGELTIPGSSAISDEEIASLFTSTAEVFDGSGSPTGMVTTTVSNVVVTIPEPSAAVLVYCAMSTTLRRV